MALANGITFEDLHQDVKNEIYQYVAPEIALKLSLLSKSEYKKLNPLWQRYFQEAFGKIYVDKLDNIAKKYFLLEGETDYKIYENLDFRKLVLYFLDISEKNKNYILEKGIWPKGPFGKITVKFIIPFSGVINLENLNEAVLRSSKFPHRIQVSTLDEALLQNADFTKTNISSATFNRANLARANLSEAKISQTQFIKANLTRANLTNAEIQTTIFKDAILKKAQLIKTKIAEETVYFYGYDKDSKLYFPPGADFTNADLSGANLTEALIAGSIFNDAILTGTIFTGATIKNCYLLKNKEDPDSEKIPLTIKHLEDNGATWDEKNPPKFE